MRRRWDIGAGARGSGCSGLEAASTPPLTSRRSDPVGLDGGNGGRSSMEVKAETVPTPFALPPPNRSTRGQGSPDLTVLDLAAVRSGGDRWWRLGGGGGCNDEFDMIGSPLEL
uniref:Uncharacterized protein n=1 Tax=Oryza sativa subsp. japonica TaxID=39947 RepID=Q6ZCR2_ORYSJ|nr:hypothetical protein [Oryza sativa Japonica Group]